jgi:hypothetical protein
MSIKCMRHHSNTVTMPALLHKFDLFPSTDMSGLYVPAGLSSRRETALEMLPSVGAAAAAAADPGPPDRPAGFAEAARLPAAEGWADITQRRKMQLNSKGTAGRALECRMVPQCEKRDSGRGCEKECCTVQSFQLHEFNSMNSSLQEFSSPRPAQHSTQRRNTACKPVGRLKLRLLSHLLHRESASAEVRRQDIDAGRFFESAHTGISNVALDVASNTYEKM